MFLVVFGRAWFLQQFFGLLRDFPAPIVSLVILTPPHLAFCPVLTENIVGEQMAKSSALLCLQELHFTRPQPQYASLSLPLLKQLLQNGLTRGIIAEANGRRSSGRTSVFLYILAQATARGEICAIIDLQDSFNPASAQAAGVQLDRILWVRCRSNAEYAIRAADLLLHAGGFGVVLLDLCEANPRILNRIPLSYWYRFRRAVEHTPAILLICSDSAQAKSCSATGLELKSQAFHWTGKAPFLLLRGIQINAIVRRALAATLAPTCSLETVI